MGRERGREREGGGEKRWKRAEEEGKKKLEKFFWKRKEDATVSLSLPACKKKKGFKRLEQMEGVHKKERKEKKERTDCSETLREDRGFIPSLIWG